MKKAKRYGIDYIKQVIDSNFSAGRDSMGLAATVLYISCQIYEDLDKSQKYIANTAGISDVTVRNRRQEITNKIPGLLTHTQGEARIAMAKDSSNNSNI